MSSTQQPKKNFFQKIGSFFNTIQEDLDNEYLVLDYQILGASLLATSTPLFAAIGLELGKRNVLGVKGSALSDIFNSIKVSPFIFFNKLRENSYPLIQGNIEDPTGELRSSWMAEYLKGSVDGSKVLEKTFKVTNPMNSSEQITVVFDNLRCFTPEIAGYQVLAKNQANVIAKYISRLDNEEVFKNVTADSSQFFSFKDVYLSGVKNVNPKVGEHLHVNSVFTNCREQLSVIETNAISKAQRICIYVTIGLAILSLTLGVRLILKKRKLNKQQEQNQ